jgi:hypothetical protein
LHGLRSFESKGFAEKHNNHREINTMADEAKRRAELARSLFIFKLFHSFILSNHDFPSYPNYLPHDAG